jgi:hypothetical protein
MRINFEVIKWGLIISGVILVFIIIFSIIFVKVKITSMPKDTSITIDGKSMGSSPYTKRLVTGKHKILINKAGYIEGAFDIQVSLRNNSFNFEIITPRQKLVNSLPLSTDEWNIYYNQLDDSISVVINKGPYEQMVNKSRAWLLENGVNLSDDKVDFSGVAGVGPNGGI